MSSIGNKNVSFNINSSENSILLPVPVLPFTYNKNIIWYDYSHAVLRTMISILVMFGLLTNVINMIVFKSQGLKDGVTLSLFALSGSDFMLSLFKFGVVVAYIWGELDPGNDIHPRSLQIACFSYPRSGAYICSTSITVYLSVERSLCVLMPFKFKTMFTKRKSMVVLLLLAVLSICSIIPPMVSQGLKWQYDPRYKKMRLSLYIKRNRTLQLLFVSVTSLFLPIISQAVICVTATLMFIGLRNADKFRNNVISRTPVEDAKSYSLTGKGKKAVRMVLSLSIVFLVCNTPTLVGAFLQLLLPGFHLSGFRNHMSLLYEIYYGVVVLFDSVSTTVNVFVYYHYSTKFKELFNKMFCCCKKDEKIFAEFQMNSEKY